MAVNESRGIIFDVDTRGNCTYILVDNDSVNL
jgi:hypothetical protein